MKSKLVKYECWGEPEDRKKYSGNINVAVDINCDCTFTTAENAVKLRKQGLISKNAVLLYTIEARSWDEAMAKHHKKQGWEPYVPFDER